MANTYTVLLSELVSEFNLDFFYKSTDFDKIRVTVDDISRPGLHLAGFFDHYEPMRVYVCGTVETAYLQKLSPEERIIIFDHFLSYKCPALIFARGFEPMPECLEMAKKYDRILSVCHVLRYSPFFSKLKELLEEIEKAGYEKNKQPQISLNWAQAVLRVEYQELPEGMIRETKVVMEDANEGER